MDQVQRLAVAAAGGVSRVQGPRDLRADVRRERLRHQFVAPPRELQRAPQRAAVDELQHEDGAVDLGFDIVGGGDDARVMQ